MSDHSNLPPSESDDEAPDGAAVFPLIPEELGVHPLFLAALHALIFFEGSDETVVHPAAAQEAAEYLTSYLQRLSGRDLQRLREDLDTIIGLGKDEQWPRQSLQYLKTFLADHGIGVKG
ncbi:hypothetical protein [Tuwongella immobilis]|uniref:Uncharacterized protein n=1 Tax=Tuwongella immobilis TaxID=692036 RepID=A0A6C2YVJ5_9BACT